MTFIQQDYPFEKRLELSTKLRTKFPDRVPIIINLSPKTKNITLKKRKFLGPKDITLSQFLVQLRKEMTIPSSHLGIYIFTEDSSLPQMTSLLTVIDNKHRNKDGFLYLTCCEENVFG